MFTELKMLLARSAPTMLQDAAGVCALIVMLYIGLNLSAFA